MQNAENIWQGTSHFSLREGRPTGRLPKNGHLISSKAMALDLPWLMSLWTRKNLDKKNEYRCASTSKASTEALQIKLQTKLPTTKLPLNPDSCPICGRGTFRMIANSCWNTSLIRHLAFQTSSRRWQKSYNHLSLGFSLVPTGHILPCIVTFGSLVHGWPSFRDVSDSFSSLLLICRTFTKRRAGASRTSTSALPRAPRSGAAFPRTRPRAPWRRFSTRATCSTSPGRRRRRRRRGVSGVCVRG
mmetsp:Transcript_76927/g.207754  ORF Transcript_76927/g.207754 Transcript_76927/m.207754 type:complete len:244 (+) Transcript_76927:116-847(+)